MLLALERTRGELVGEGVSAEVFGWGQDRVVKLFREKFRYVAAPEAPRAAAVAGSGAAVPAYHGEVEVDGRPGIVFDRVAGPRLIDRLKGASQSPSQRHEVGRELARVHLALHEHTSDALHPLGETLSAALRDRAANWPRELRELTRARIEAFPDGSALFHGDFHPGNVIEAEPGAVVIDWSNACLAHPALDVARAEICMRYQGVPGSLPTERARAIRSSRDEIVDAYLEAYVEGSDRVSRGDVEAGLPHFAAALVLAQPDTFDHQELRRLAELQEA